MSAKPNFVFVLEHRKEWEDLWWILADNDVTKYNEIKRLEVVQFYNFLERWKEAMRKKQNSNEMSKEYLIGLGLDGEKLFKNFKDTIGLLEQVEAKSGEVGNAMDSAFDKGVQASNEFDKKMQNTSKNLEVVREMGKLAGKEMADALSGKNINSSDFTRKINDFKKALIR